MKNRDDDEEEEYSGRFSSDYSEEDGDFDAQEDEEPRRGVLAFVIVGYVAQINWRLAFGLLIVHAAVLLLLSTATPSGDGYQVIHPSTFEASTFVPAADGRFQPLSAFDDDLGTAWVSAALARLTFCPPACATATESAAESRLLVRVVRMRIAEA